MGSTPEENTGKSFSRLIKDILYKEATSGQSSDELLVVATLIAAVTFQAGVNPPGGVWQDNDNGHVAGRSIYASHKIAFSVFLICNTFALSTSILVLISLTRKLHLYFEICAAMTSMIVIYGSAVFAITPSESVHFRYILLAALAPFARRCLILMFKKKDASTSPS